MSPPSGEVSRRGVFTRRYKDWGRDLKTRVGKERAGECEKRGDFHEQLTGHFLTTLFRGNKPGGPSPILSNITPVFGSWTKLDKKGKNWT